MGLAPYSRSRVAYRSTSHCPLFQNLRPSNITSQDKLRRCACPCMQQLTLSNHCAQVLRGDLEAAIANAGNDTLVVQCHAHLHQRIFNAVKI